MTTDAWLAIAHHLAVFALVIALAAELGAVRVGMTAPEVERVGRIDALYGAAAGLVIAAGVARVFLGDQDESYYFGSVTFWIKMAALATVALLSISPTMRYLRWRRLLETGAVPDDGEVRAAQRFLRLQLVVLPVIPICAALMARGIGT